MPNPLNGIRVLQYCFSFERMSDKEDYHGQDKTAKDPKHLNISNASSMTSYALIASKYVV